MTLVAVLSLTVFPAFVQAAGHRYVEYGDSATLSWSINSWVDCYWDDNYVINQPQSTKGHYSSANGITVFCTENFWDNAENSYTLYGNVVRQHLTRSSATLGISTQRLGVAPHTLYHMVASVDTFDPKANLSSVLRAALPTPPSFFFFCSQRN